MAARKWRRREHRAQVSAIATILGLMLVVTFIANYLATTLPNQMAVNDLDHELQVENQLGHFSQALQAVSAGAIVGAPLAQPVSLGSQGAPPFANPDGSTISPLRTGTNASVNFGVVSTQYAPPTGWKAGGSFTPACTPQPSSGSAMNISCNGAGNAVNYNFTNCPSGCSINGNAAGTYWANYSVNSSIIAVSQTGGSNGFEHVELVGSYDSLSVKGTGGGGDVINVTIVGSYDSLSISDSSQATVVVLLVGLHNTVTFSAAGSSNSLVLRGWGAYNSYTTSSGSGNFRVYYTGFDPTAATNPICPYDSLSMTNTVSGGSGAGRTVTYNNTLPSSRASGWTYVGGSVQSTCVFFPSFPGNGGRNVPAASLLVQLHNTYAPSAEIAFDEGAVVYAQPGGYPVLIDPPPISFSYGIATVWLPAFVQPVVSEAGIGTAVVSTHLVSVQRYTFPGGGWVLSPSQSVTLVYHTPYGSAWYGSSFAVSLRLAGGAITCTPLASTACTGPYEPGGGLATIQVTLPATMLTLNVATFSVTVD